MDFRQVIFNFFEKGKRTLTKLITPFNLPMCFSRVHTLSSLVILACFFDFSFDSSFLHLWVSDRIKALTSEYWILKLGFWILKRLDLLKQTLSFTDSYLWFFRSHLFFQYYSDFASLRKILYWFEYHSCFQMALLMVSLSLIVIWVASLCKSFLGTTSTCSKTAILNDGK